MPPGDKNRNSFPAGESHTPSRFLKTAPQAAQKYWLSRYKRNGKRSCPQAGSSCRYIPYRSHGALAPAFRHSSLSASAAWDNGNFLYERGAYSGPTSTTPETRTTNKTPSKRQSSVMFIFVPGKVSGVAKAPHACPVLPLGMSTTVFLLPQRHNLINSGKGHPSAPHGRPHAPGISAAHLNSWLGPYAAPFSRCGDRAHAHPEPTVNTGRPGSRKPLWAAHTCQE